MATALDYPKDKKDKTDQSMLGQFNPPDLDDEDEPRNRPIETAKQALQILKRFEKDNKSRADRNKAIADAYNGVPPYVQKDLDDANQGWRSNFSILFLASIVERVTPRFIDAINSVKYLTNSTLPGSFENAEDKTETFRSEATKLFREWPGLMDMLDRIVTENVTYGYTASVQLDKTDWRPKTYRQEDILFDEHAPQVAENLNVFVVKADYFIHELIEILQDPDISELAGFHTINLRRAIASAMPRDNDGIDNPRKYADMVRDANLYYSYHERSKKIQTAHIYVKNYDGKVDHWWINRKEPGDNEEYEGKDDPEYIDDEDRDGIKLFYLEDECLKMEEVITLFSLQAGNNHLFGSKGVGRQLINISLAIDRAFMNFIDSMYLAALLTAEADPTKIAQMQPQVTNPFLVVPDGMKLTGIEVNVNVDAFTSLKAQLTQIAEQIAGTFMPASVENNGQSVQTATEASIDAQREEEIRQGILNRWMTQFYRMIGTMQKRAFNTDNIKAAIKVSTAKQEAQDKGMQMVTSEVMTELKEVSKNASKLYIEAPDLKGADADAVETILALLEGGLSAEEILVLASTPASVYSPNIGAQQDAKFLQFYPTVKGDPNWDQNKLEERKGMAMIGPDETKSIFIPSPTTTAAVEAARQQAGEFNDILAGTNVPVSGRDSHLDHLTALGPLVAAKLQSLHQMTQTPGGGLAIPPELVQAMMLALQHAGQHIQMLLQSGKSKKELAPIQKAFTEAQQIMKEVQASIDKDTADHQQMMAQAQAQQGAPPAPPDPNAPPNPQMALPPGHPDGAPINPHAIQPDAHHLIPQGPGHPAVVGQSPPPLMPQQAPPQIPQ